MQNNILTPDDVRWAYRILLDRECESDEMIKEKLAKLPSRARLREDLLSSIEYHSKRKDFRQFITAEECLVIKQSNGFRVHLDLSEYISMEIANDNYDRHESEFVRKCVKPGDTVLDLGAHVGYYTLLLASIVGEKGKVFSFEPQQHLFSLMQASIKENLYDDRIVVENCCVGSVSGKFRFARLETPGDCGGSHLLISPTVMPAFGDMVIEPASVVSLGDYDFPSPIDFIKIDIEGSEYLALKSLKDRLKKEQPIILSEVNQPLLAHVSGVSSAEYIRLLQDCGYKCYILNECNKIEDSIDDTSVECQNVVFVPNEE